MTTLLQIALQEAARRDNPKRSEETPKRASKDLRCKLKGLEDEAKTQIIMLDERECSYGSLRVTFIPNNENEILEVYCITPQFHRPTVLKLHSELFWHATLEDKGHQIPRLWANVYDPLGNSQRVSTQEIDGTVPLEPFITLLGKALATWFQNPRL